MSGLAISELTTFRWSFEEDVDRYVSAGVPAIGVWRQKLADFGEEKGIELLSRAGLRVSSLQWAGGFTGSDGRTHAESIADAREAIRLAHALGAGSLLVHSGARGIHTHNHARRLFRTALEKILPIAEEHGVDLAIEPRHSDVGADWTFLHEIDESLALIGQLGSTRLRLAFDTYYWGRNEALLARLPELAPQIAIVHLADSREPPTPACERCPLGAGSVNLAAILAGLAQGGYRGYYEVELSGEEIETCDYGELLQQSRSKFAELSG